MRRFVLICLLLTLPLQWGWAAAAAVCQHEADGAAHFGHHPHEHCADSAAAGKTGAADSDCATCHGPGVPALMAPVVLALQAFVSVPPEAPLLRFVQRAPDNPLRPPPADLA